MGIEVGQIEYLNFNERDVEVPALISFLSDGGWTSSILDVGGHYSWYTYAPKVRALMAESMYVVSDLLEDPPTKEIVDEYIVGDASLIAAQGRKFDLVFSVSVLEHVGINPIRAEDPVLDRRRLFTSICQMAKKAAFLTFPYGREGEYPGQYENVILEELIDFKDIASKYGFSLITQFFFNLFPQGRELWSEVSISRASEIEMDRERGVQCVCLATLVRSGK